MRNTSHDKICNSERISWPQTNKNMFKTLNIIFVSKLVYFFNFEVWNLENSVVECFENKNTAATLPSASKTVLCSFIARHFEEKLSGSDILTKIQEKSSSDGK